jgi:4-coumarate--CoA ligase
VFQVRGFQVSGDELEVLIRNHPDVDEVCVLGVPDPYSGEVPVALVVLGDEAKERMERDNKEAQKISISILKARSATTTPHLRGMEC